MNDPHELYISELVTPSSAIDCAHLNLKFKI